MSEAYETHVRAALQPVPLPPGLTSCDLVRRAVRFEKPPRIPYSFFAPPASDLFETSPLSCAPDERRADVRALVGLGMGSNPGAKTGEEYSDRWGARYKVTGHVWDHAFGHPLSDLDDLDGFVFPQILAPEILEPMAPYVRRGVEAGKFVVGGDMVLLFERARVLMGFEALAAAPYLQPAGLRKLLDRLAEVVIALIEAYGRMGCHAFMTWEDFGLQNKMQMRPATFREFYKPVYSRIIDAAHRNGMAYIWHNCGWILEQIPDLIDIGLDVLQLDQPKLMGYERIDVLARGKLCVWPALDIQWTTSDGVTRADFPAEIATMLRAFYNRDGGLIYRQYPAPADIGLTVEDDLAIFEGFMQATQMLTT